MNPRRGCPRPCRSDRTKAPGTPRARQRTKRWDGGIDGEVRLGALEDEAHVGGERLDEIALHDGQGARRRTDRASHGSLARGHRGPPGPPPAARRARTRADRVRQVPPRRSPADRLVRRWSCTRWCAGASRKAFQALGPASARGAAPCRAQNHDRPRPTWAVPDAAHFLDEGVAHGRPLSEPGRGAVSGNGAVDSACRSSVSPTRARAARRPSCPGRTSRAPRPAPARVRRARRRAWRAALEARCRLRLCGQAGENLEGSSGGQLIAHHGRRGVRRGPLTQARDEAGRAVDDPEPAHVLGDGVVALSRCDREESILGALLENLAVPETATGEDEQEQPQLLVVIDERQRRRRGRLARRTGHARQRAPRAPAARRGRRGSRSPRGARRWRNRRRTCTCTGSARCACGPRLRHRPRRRNVPWMGNLSWNRKNHEETPAAGRCVFDPRRAHRRVRCRKALCYRPRLQRRHAAPSWITTSPASSRSRADGRVTERVDGGGLFRRGRGPDGRRRMARRRDARPRRRPPDPPRLARPCRDREGADLDDEPDDYDVPAAARDVAVEEALAWRRRPRSTSTTRYRGGWRRSSSSAT